MMPIVDGLEDKHDEEVVFIWLDAAGDEGRETFRYYGLPGHPSFLLLNPSGDVLWSGFGEISEETIELELLSNIPKTN